MPAVDIEVPKQPGESKEGFGTGIPTPILLMFVGGGIGLIVFLTRKAGTPSDGQKGTLLPNTAIMLGSLQQGILDLQGKVTTGNADLSSQLTGVGENLGAEIDTQSAQLNQSFASLNTYLQGSLGTVQASENQLTQAIASLGTQNVGLAQSLTTILQNLGVLQTETQQAVSNTAANANIATQGYQSLLGQVNQILATQTVNTSQLNQLGQQVIPINLGSGYFVGNDHRVHIGSYQGTGQPGYGSSQGLMSDPSWPVGSSSSDPNVFFSQRTV